MMSDREFYKLALDLLTKAWPSPTADETKWYGKKSEWVREYVEREERRTAAEASDENLT